MRNSLMILGATLAGILFLSPTARARTSWTALNIKPGDKNFMYALDVLDKEHAWFLGVDSSSGNSQMVAYRTTDGEHLTMIGLPAPSTSQGVIMFSTLAFASQDTGYITGSEVEMSFPPKSHNNLWQTTNGGMSWTPLKTDMDEPISILRSMPTGEIFGTNGSQIIIIRDGSLTTSDLPQTTDKIRAMDVRMINTTCGYAVGGQKGDDNGDAPGNGIVWRTSDGGSTWEVVSSGLPFSVHAASFISSRTGWIGGYDLDRAWLYHTTDGGNTWKELQIPPHPATGLMGDNEEHPLTDIVYIKFFDRNRGLLVGLACISNCRSDSSSDDDDDPFGNDGGSQESPTILTAVYWTSDGGNTWEFDTDIETAMQTGNFMPEMMVYSPMAGAKFPSPNYGYTAGKNLLVLKYVADSPEDEPDGYPSCDENSDDDNGTGGNGNGTGDGTDDSASGSSDGGCSCATPATAGSSVPMAALFLAVVLAFVIRRRY